MLQGTDRIHGIARVNRIDIISRMAYINEINKPNRHNGAIGSSIVLAIIHRPKGPNGPIEVLEPREHQGMGQGFNGLSAHLLGGRTGGIARKQIDCYRAKI